MKHLEQGGTRLLTVDFALRDEQVNVAALTGQISGITQILLCKKKLLSNTRLGPFLLDQKRSKPTFPLSASGLKCQDLADNHQVELSYVAYVDMQIRIETSRECFEWLCPKFFSVWAPEAPHSYFQGKKDGYLVLFRVYSLTKPIESHLLEKGRAGRNFYFGLSEPGMAKLDSPIIPNAVFAHIKQDLISGLDEHGFLLSVT